jgi:hypothetical protein
MECRFKDNMSVFHSYLTFPPLTNTYRASYL